MIYRYEKFIFTDKTAREVETMIKLLKGNFQKFIKLINNIY